MTTDTINCKPTKCTARTSSMFIGRYGGLPISAVPSSEDLIDGLLERLISGSEVLREKVDPLVERIFSLVPLVTDKKERRMILSAKRNVFSLRKSGLDDDLFSLIDVHDNSLGKDLRTWDSEVGRQDELEDYLVTLISIQEERLVAQLRANLAEERFITSLAVAAPGFVRAIKSGKAEESPFRYARTLYLYGSRTTRKTSPFAGLTVVGFPGRKGKGRRLARAAAHVAWAALEDVIKGSGVEGKFAVDLATVRRVDIQGHESVAIHSRRRFADGVAYREDTVIGAENVLPHLQKTMHHTPTGRLLPAEVAEVFGGDNSEARFQRLLASGVIQPSVGWDRDRDPFAYLDEKLTKQTGYASANLINDASVVPDQFPTARVEERLELLGSMEKLALSVLTDFEVVSGTPGLIYEDREPNFMLRNPLEFKAVREDLSTLAELTAPCIFRSHIYDLMLSRFVEKFGRGGISNDPLAFFMSLSLEGDGDPELYRALQNDYICSPEEKIDRQRPLGATTVARHLGAYIQFVAPDADTLAGGKGLTVVNMFGTGIGGVEARFHRLLESDFANVLRSHVRGLWKTDTILEFQPWANCNTGQASCSGVLPELQLPGEPRSDDGLNISDMRLHHDIAKNALELTYNDVPVGLAYLGLTPQYMLTSYWRWLGMLSDPWVKVPPHSDHSARLADSPSKAEEGIVHSPRVQHGRLVTKRESWILPMRELTAVWQNEDIELLKSVYRIRRNFGIPVELFVYQEGGKKLPRKPFFVDMGSPLSLRSLEKWIDPSARYIRLVEALPNKKQHWVRDARGLPVVSEFTVNINWQD